MQGTSAVRIRSAPPASCPEKRNRHEPSPQFQTLDAEFDLRWREQAECVSSPAVAAVPGCGRTVGTRKLRHSYPFAETTEIEDARCRELLEESELRSGTPEPACPWLPSIGMRCLRGS